MTIEPFVFYVLFYLLVFLVGCDFSLSGFLVLQKNIDSLEKPRLLGLLIIKVMQASRNTNKRDELSVFSPKVMGIYTLIAGILLIVASMLMVT